MMTSELSEFIKNKAYQLGFEACGIAKATPIPESEIDYFKSWLRKGYHGMMNYLENNSEKRYDPRLLVKDCSSVIIVAMNYKPTRKQNPDAPKIAGFAYGKDYHYIIREKLRTLLKAINKQGLEVHGRAFADSAPVLERYWALQAGLGWIGKNHHLIIPHKGSYFLLGELMVDIELDYDSPQPNRCGNCQRCIEACPSNALTLGSGLDARSCISYLTIEKRKDFNIWEASIVGNNDWLFGCDICQDACPWNRFSKSSDIPELSGKPEFLSMERDDYKNMTEEDFKRIFGDTCLSRCRYEGFIRNLKANKESDHH